MLNREPMQAGGGNWTSIVFYPDREKGGEYEVGITWRLGFAKVQKLLFSLVYPNKIDGLHHPDDLLVCVGFVGEVGCLVGWGRKR